MYLGLRRTLGLVVLSRRFEADKSVELVVFGSLVPVLERQLHSRVQYRRVDGALLAALGRLLPQHRWRTSLVTPETADPLAQICKSHLDNSSSSQASKRPLLSRAGRRPQRSSSSSRLRMLRAKASKGRDVDHPTGLVPLSWSRTGYARNCGARLTSAREKHTVAPVGASTANCSRQRVELHRFFWWGTTWWH